MLRRHVVGAFGALMLVVVLVAVFGGRSSVADAGRRACAAQVSLGVIPAWARAGFSDRRPRMAHELGRDGRIVALIWGYPLLSPPSSHRTNKILWVSRRLSSSPTALWIHAQRLAGTRAVGNPVTRVVAGGPGPSIVNLPAKGCWRLTLSWADRTDSLDLQYR